MVAVIDSLYGACRFKTRENQRIIGIETNNNVSAIQSTEVVNVTNSVVSIFRSVINNCIVASAIGYRDERSFCTKAD